MNHDGAYEQRIRDHIFRFESPDVCRMTFVGDISERDMHDYYAAIIRSGEGKRWILTMLDMTRIGKADHQARQAGTHAPRIIRGSVIFGASFKQRMGTSLLHRAATLMRGKSEVTLGFVETEAHAREWLAGRREELERQMASAA